MTHIIYEAALIQFRPVPSAEERLNVGAIIFDPERGHIAWRLSEHYRRLGAIYPHFDGRGYRFMVRAVEARMRRNFGHAVNPEQGVLIRGVSTLRDALAVTFQNDGSNLTHSSIRYGHCVDLRLRLDQLFSEFVGSLEQQPSRERIDNDALWERVRRHRDFVRVTPILQESVTLRTKRYSHTFRAGWQNGHQQVVEPITLDYLDGNDMLERAVTWTGRLAELAKGNQFSLIAIVTEPPEGALRSTYQHALELLAEPQQLRQVLTDSQVGELSALIAKEAETHHYRPGERIQEQVLGDPNREELDEPKLLT